MSHQGSERVKREIRNEAIMRDIEQPAETEGLLSPYRVLDLAGETGILAGKILADLGADVIAVEPPEGNPVRQLGPFYKGRPDPERSLVWWAYAAGKRSITLDLEAEEGAALLVRLATRADFLFESFLPGYLDRHGVGYQALRQANPALILVSMTPFGQDGPYAGYKGPDLVGMALGGFVNLAGDPDRPPVRASEPQFGRLTGASGAAGAMAAHHHRILTGEGQLVDVSGQQAVARVLSEAPATWSLNRVDIRRGGPYRTMAGGQRTRTTWPCGDGYISYYLSGARMGAGTNALFRWMAEEGVVDEPFGPIDWTAVDTRNMPEDLSEWANGRVESFFSRHSKQELYQGAMERRIVLFPVNTPADIHHDPQVRARGFFTEIEHPEEKLRVDYPGGFVQSSQAQVGPRRRAPTLGEHNTEIYVDDLGLTTAEMKRLKKSGRVHGRMRKERECRGASPFARIERNET